MNENITILVPAYNEGGNIKRCLEAIAVHKLPKDIKVDVIIIPNGCTDKTEKIARDFIKSKIAQKNKQISWKVLALKEGHKAKAMNAGRKLAKTDIVFSTDADCYLAKDAIYKIYQKINNNKNIKVFGGHPISVFSGLKKNSLLYQIQMAHSILRQLNPRLLPNGGLIGFRNKFIPSFPTNTPSEDIWLPLYSAKKFGFDSILVVDSSIFYLYAAKTWPDLLKMEARSGYATQHLVKKYRDLAPLLKDFKDKKLKMRTKDLDKEIFAKMKQGNIPLEVYSLGKKFFYPMIKEYMQEMGGDPIFDKGKWEVIKSTKSK